VDQEAEISDMRVFQAIRAEVLLVVVVVILLEKNRTKD
jgi:hypothetical protein